MPDNSLHELLQAFVRQDEPPIGLTAVGVVKAARRTRRTRRASVLAGIAGVVALAIAGIAILPRILPRQGPAFGALAPCVSSPVSRPAETANPSRALPPDIATWAAAALTCALAEAVPRLLPDAQFAQEPGLAAGPLIGYTHDDDPPFGNRVDAMALMRNQHGTGDLYISVSVIAAEDAQSMTADCQHSQGAGCDVGTPEPDVTALMSHDYPAVDVLRGNTAIHVELAHAELLSADDGKPAGTTNASVLAPDQALALALSPQLYLFP